MKRQVLVRNALSALVLFILLTVLAGRVAADDTSSAAVTATLGDTTAAAAVQALQQSIAEQRELLTAQASQIERQQQQIREQDEQLKAMENQLMQLVAAQNGAAGGSAGQAGQILPMESIEQQAVAGDSSQSGQTMSQQRDAAERLRDPEAPTEVEPDTLPGYVHVPGTDSSMRLGGYVKMSIVDSFDPVGSADRFLVGSIPVTEDDTAVENQSSLSTRSSRLNLDVRRESAMGPLRAFIEGDFAGEGDTYRLRHAYGQFGRVLVGKTWSTFVDSQVNPEEIDFEGLNGRVNVRQPQLRFFPTIGEHLDLAIAVEDPKPDVTGGTGLTQTPDFVASIRLSKWDRLHVKTALLLRQIRARPDADPSAEVRETGWGLSVSGRVNISQWGERDDLMFQLNYGDGIGRYINDLGSVGGQDAVFDPAAGELRVLTAFGGYIAFEHWWSEKMRSTFVAGLTEVENYSFQPGDAYHQTKRITANLLFSPIPRVDVGAELLWGERTNKDGNSGDAVQLQIAAKYIF